MRSTSRTDHPGAADVEVLGLGLRAQHQGRAAHKRIRRFGSDDGVVDAEAFDEPQGALELRVIGEGGHGVHQLVAPSAPPGALTRVLH